MKYILPNLLPILLIYNNLRNLRLRKWLIWRQKADPNLTPATDAEACISSAIPDCQPERPDTRQHLFMWERVVGKAALFPYVPPSFPWLLTQCVPICQSPTGGLHAGAPPTKGHGCNREESAGHLEARLIWPWEQPQGCLVAESMVSEKNQ